MTNESTLYNWCLEQAATRAMGNLSQDKIDKLNSIGFPWAYYAEKLEEACMSDIEALTDLVDGAYND